MDKKTVCGTLRSRGKGNFFSLGLVSKVITVSGIPCRVRFGSGSKPSVCAGATSLQQYPSDKRQAEDFHLTAYFLKAGEPRT